MGGGGGGRVDERSGRVNKTLRKIHIKAIINESPLLIISFFNVRQFL